MIRLLVPSMPPIEAAIPYFRKSEEARWYSNGGPCVKLLEERLSERYGGASVVTVSNATVGLELVYTLRMMRGFKKIELPALTFAATWLAATRGGLEILPIDVDRETWIAAGVAGFGLPSWGPVVDAAGAFGEQKVPPGMTAVFSGHATKTMGAGELGWIVTWDQGEADELRSMSNFHIVSGVSTGFGTNCKVPEITAAMALAALDAYDREAWLGLYDFYQEHLPTCAVAQKRPRGAYSLMPVRLPCAAQGVLEAMKARGIETRRYYCPPLHHHPMYVSPGLNRAERRKKAYPPLPVTDHLAEHLLALPWHLSLCSGDVARVCETLAECVEDAEEADVALPA